MSKVVLLVPTELHQAFNDANDDWKWEHLQTWSEAEETYRELRGKIDSRYEELPTEYVCLRDGNNSARIVMSFDQHGIDNVLVKGAAATERPGDGTRWIKPGQFGAFRDIIIHARRLLYPRFLAGDMSTAPQDGMTLSPYGGVIFTKDGVLHREDGPAYEEVFRTNNSIQSNEAWFMDGELHRDNDLPAYRAADSEYQWMQRGLPHRTDGPAHIRNYNGKTIVEDWYTNGSKREPDSSKMSKQADILVIAQNDEVFIGMPRTREAAEAFERGTYWPTHAPAGKKFDAAMQNRGVLVMIEFRNGGVKWQLNFDAWDVELLDENSNFLSGDAIARQWHLVADLFLWAAEYNLAILDYVPRYLLDERFVEVVARFLAHTPDSWKDIPWHALTEQAIRRACQENSGVIYYLPKTYITRDICAEAIKYHPHAFTFVPKELQDISLYSSALVHDRHTHHQLSRENSRSLKFRVATVTLGSKLIGGIFRAYARRQMSKLWRHRNPVGELPRFPHTHWFDDASFTARIPRTC
jgi:hypothetical protein